MDSAPRMQYSPISLLRKSVRGDMVPSKRIRDLYAKPWRATRHHPAWIVAESCFDLPLKTILPCWMVPCDSYSANQSSSARPLLPPRKGALAACPARGGTARRCARGNRECAMNPQTRTAEGRDDGRTRGRGYSGTFPK